MDTGNIIEILRKFESNFQRGILIEGTWGIGKTYQINKFIEDFKRRNKSEKILYISLFGLKSIDDLHTELYSKIHPFKKGIILASGYVNPALSLIPNAGKAISSTISFAIGNAQQRIKNTKKIKQVTKKRIIIILDDLERVNENFDYSELLGYINRLYLSGIKVVCICDPSKIKKPSFNDLKEKIFDRYYKVTKANEEIIKSYFDDQALVFDQEVLSLYDNNLRTAFKVSLFYREISDFMDKKDEKDYFKLEKSIILWYASLIVSAINNFSQEIENNEKEIESEKIYLCFFKKFQEKDLTYRLFKCAKIDKGSTHSIEFTEYKTLGSFFLISAFAYAYLFDNYEELENLLVKKMISETKKDERIIPLFYLSAEERKEEIKKIITSTIEGNQILTESQLQYILTIFEWPEIENIEYDEDILINSIATRCMGAGDQLRMVSDLFDYYYDDCPKTKNVIKKIREAYVIKMNLSIISNLKYSFEVKDYNKVSSILDEINQNYVYHDSINNDLSTEIKNSFTNNNFFLPSVKGTINEEDWRLVHKISNFICKYEFKKEYLEYLKVLINASKDIDEISRLKQILKQYFSNISSQ